jgi:hypothetical protein
MGTILHRLTLILHEHCIESNVRDANDGLSL